MRKRSGADAEDGGVRALADRRFRLSGRRLGRRGTLRRVAWLFGLLGSIAVTFAWARATHAQEGGRPAADTEPKPLAPPEALEHYERGRKEYLAGRYKEALQELRAALELDPSSPNLVYNVARVYEDLSELDQAIKYYRRYRSLLPADATAERDKTAKTIRRLEGARDEQTQAQLERMQSERTAQATAPPDAGEHASSSGTGRADLAFWLVASAGVALAAGGGVTGWFALRREQEVNDFVLGEDGTYEEREKLVKEANNLALTSDILIASAGATILTAALLYFTRSPEPDAAAALRVMPGGAGLRFTF